MVLFRRIAALLVPVMIFASAICFTASANTYTGLNDLEVVLLFDVSGSMNQSDMERNSITGAEIFAIAAKTGRNLFIKVIPYNHEVYTGFATVNVSTENGWKEFRNQLSAIENDEANDGVPGMECWRSDAHTDFSKALSAAKEYFTQKSDKTDAQRAVILFTDGQLDIYTSDSVTARDIEKTVIDEKADKEYIKLADEFNGEIRKYFADREYPAEDFGISAQSLKVVAERYGCSVDTLRELFYRGSDNKEAGNNRLYRYVFIDELDAYLASVHTSAELREKEIPVYSIGFKYTVLDDVFMKQISENFNDDNVVTSSTDLVNLFHGIVNDFYVYKDDINDGYYLTTREDENVPTEHTVRVYGGITKHLSITLHSSYDVIDSVTVTSPSGQIYSCNPKRVEDSNSASVVPDSRCRFDIMRGNKGVNIELPNPEGGEWRITTVSGAGTLHEKTTTLYELSANTDIPDTDIYIDEPFRFYANYYNNDKDSYVTDKFMYVGDPGIRALFSVKEESEPDYEESVYGSLDESGAGYDFEWQFKKPGTYNLRIELCNPLIFEENQRIIHYETVNVIGPETIMDVSNSDGSEISKRRTVKLSIVNPLTKEKMPLPDYAKDASLDIFLKGIDNDYSEKVEISGDELQSGEYTYTHTFDETGNYKISAEFRLSKDIEPVKYQAEVFIKPSSLSKNRDIDELLTHGISRASFQREYVRAVDVTGAFSDEDGDEIDYYIVEPEEEASESIVFAEVVESAGENGEPKTEIVITCTDYGEGEVTVLASDNNGAEAMHTIRIEHKSGWWIVNLIIAAAAVIALVLVVILFKAVTAPKPSINFVITVRDNRTNKDVGRFDVDTKSPNNRKYVKAKMMLYDYMGGTLSKGGFSDDADKERIEDFTKRIKVKGYQQNRIKLQAHGSVKYIIGYGHGCENRAPFTDKNGTFTVIVECLG